MSYLFLITFMYFFTLPDGYYCYSQLTNEKTVEQRSYIIYPRSHSYQVTISVQMSLVDACLNQLRLLGQDTFKYVLRPISIEGDRYYPIPTSNFQKQAGYPRIELKPILTLSTCRKQQSHRLGLSPQDCKPPIPSNASQKDRLLLPVLPAKWVQTGDSHDLLLLGFNYLLE